MAFLATLRLVWFSLCPPSSASVSPVSLSVDDGWLVLSPSAFPAFLAAPAACLDVEGALRLQLADVSPWGAPALLFRLKRQGFSAVVAVRDAGGLRLQARR